MNAQRARIDSLTTWLRTFAAELTAAVYLVALRQGNGDCWLDLELGIWKAVSDTIDKWEPQFSLADGRRPGSPDPS
jgi:hypothetical protein